jgi:hypothetical protein
VELLDIERAYERLLAPVAVPDTGETARVVFRGLSPVEFAQLKSRLRDESLTIYDHVAGLVTALPDLTDEGQPVKLTREVLDRFDARFVQAMLEAALALHTYTPTEFVNGQLVLSEPLLRGEPCGLTEEWRGEE